MAAKVMSAHSLETVPTLCLCLHVPRESKSHVTTILSVPWFDPCITSGAADKTQFRVSRCTQTADGALGYSPGMQPAALPYWVK